MRSGRNGSGIERVDELLDERFFHISVESEKTDEGEKLEKIPVLFRRVLEGLFGDGRFFLYILPELGELVLFQAEHFLIDVFDAEISALLEIFVRQRFQEGLNIGNGEKIFEIIDEGQDQHVLPGIFFLRGRRKQIIFRIIVDHGLGEDLVLGITPGLLQVFFHKRSHLVHVKINVRDILWPDVIQTGKVSKMLFSMSDVSTVIGFTSDFFFINPLSGF